MHFKLKTKNKDLGFTLIELLVVIAIISLISSIIFASVSKARIKARDTNRISAINALRTAFNMSASGNNGLFVSSGGAWVCVSAACTGGWAGIIANAAVDAAIIPYIKKPDDPYPSTRPYAGYVYNNSWSAGGYPQGVYLTWTVESTGTKVCGGGQTYVAGGNYTQCVLKID